MQVVDLDISYLVVLILQAWLHKSRVLVECYRGTRAGVVYHNVVPSLPECNNCDSLLASSAIATGYLFLQF